MINGNEPINPTFFKDGEQRCEGLTVRQHFAAMAMQGILSGYDVFDRAWLNPSDVASQSCVYADALIAELNK